MILDATTLSLEILLAGAVAANQVVSVVHWADVTTTAFTPGSTRTASNNTTAVTAAAAPASSTQRRILSATWYNADTSDVTLTVRLNDNSTMRTLCKPTLRTGETLMFDGKRFVVMDTNGREKVVTFNAGLLANVVALTDGATIAVDASLGSTFNVTLGGNRQFANPTNPTNGQRILFRIRQDGTGTRVPTWDTAYRFSSGVGAPTLSTAAAALDYVLFEYNGTDGKWDCLAYTIGFT